MSAKRLSFLQPVSSYWFESSKRGSPSGCSKSRSSSLQDASKGLSRSQSWPSTYIYASGIMRIYSTETVVRQTLAMTSLSARLFEIPLAMSMGDVSQLFPVFSAPSGRTTAMSSRGWAGKTSYLASAIFVLDQTERTDLQ